MNSRLSFLLLFHWTLSISWIVCNQQCSREASRSVRDYFTRALGPIYEKNQIAIPLECVLSPIRDLYYRQELHKVKISNDRWLCKYCNKSFLSEYYLDLHFNNRHNNTLTRDERTVCLADYCPIFRCDALKRPKKSLRSLNPFVRRSPMMRPKSKKVINEQQLNSLRTQCASLINRCIPQNVHYDARVKIHNQMYAEVCAYLTAKRYFELPTYRKPLVNFATIFCLVVLMGMCLVGIGVITHSDWRFDDQDHQQSEKSSTDDGSLPGTSTSTDTSTNGANSSTKNPESTLRQRWRSHGQDGVGYQHGHSHGHSHAHSPSHHQNRPPSL